MSNIEDFMDTVGQTIRKRKTRDSYFSTLDLTYAYGQLPLNPETSVQGNFSLVGGNQQERIALEQGFTA